MIQARLCATKLPPVTAHTCSCSMPSMPACMAVPVSSSCPPVRLPRAFPLPTCQNHASASAPSLPATQPAPLDFERSLYAHLHPPQLHSPGLLACSSCIVVLPSLSSPHGVALLPVLPSPTFSCPATLSPCPPDDATRTHNGKSYSATWGAQLRAVCTVQSLSTRPRGQWSLRGRMGCRGGWAAETRHSGAYSWRPARITRHGAALCMLLAASCALACP